MLAKSTTIRLRCCRLCSTKSYDSIAEIREVMRGLVSTDASNLGSIAPHVSLDLSHNRIANLTLHNPRRRNAVTPRMMAELADCVDILEQHCVRADGTAHGLIESSSTSSVWDGSCLVLQGEGSFFCAGMDLTVLQEPANTISQSTFGEYMSVLMCDTLNRLQQLPLVSVAAVEGGAMGGGAEAMTSCDHIVVGANARVQFVHATMGLTPGWGGATRLTRAVGRRSALRLLAGSAVVVGEEVERIGLADTIVKDGSVVDTVMAKLQGEHEGVRENSISIASSSAAEQWRYAHHTLEPVVVRALKRAVHVADSEDRSDMYACP